MSGRNFLTACFFALAALFGWLFYTRYWEWRDCIHEAASSCITPDGANLISAGFFWGPIAALFLAGALLLMLKR